MYVRYGTVKSKCEKVHDYIGMAFNLCDKNKLDINMIDYMNAMVDSFTTKLN